MTTKSTWAARALLARRRATLGPHSPLFYEEPVHLVGGEGVWLEDASGVRYLDAYNNVPHVGHANPVVVNAIASQAAALNVNTRYLHAPVVEYAEALLATFLPPLDRVMFTNSGSESNELALRIARQHTGNSGMLVTDHSYHGNTAALAELTTGLQVKEPRGSHVRALSIPDLVADRRPNDVIMAEALQQARVALDSLTAAGHGVAALLVDPLLSTEGLLAPPEGYLRALSALVRQAGGVVIADEVQSGLGRVGSHFWGFESHRMEPDLVTLGKPLGNGHPVGGVVMAQELLDEFGEANLYFSTFAGNPVSAAAGLAVLQEMGDRELQAQALAVGAHAREMLDKIAAEHSSIAAVRGSGLFFGLQFVGEDGGTGSDRAAWIVEDMRKKGVLISKIGPDADVLKIRPPLVFEHEHVDMLIDRLVASLDDLEAAESQRRATSRTAAFSSQATFPGPVADDLATVRTGLFIDGTWRQAGRTFVDRNPATGEVLTHVSEASDKDVNDAVRAAHRALEGEWARTSPPQRGVLLRRLADLVERDAEKLVHLEALDVGKPLAQPRMLDVPNAVGTFRHYAGWADRIHGDAIPTAGYMGRPTHSYTVREPIGVIAAIIPWNTPLMIAAWKLGPALAAGNTVVVKPAEDAPLSILHLASLIGEAGFPPGVVNVVPGSGAGAGAALVRHPDVDKVSFTGSPEVGREIQNVAADTFKRVALELGGKSPHVVLPDADIARAVEGIAMGLFFNQGEVCAAGTRVLVHRSIYDRVVEGLAEAASQVAVGDPFDPATSMGPLVSEVHRDRVMRYVEQGRAEGARLVAGGSRLPGKGYFVQPTVFADVDPAATIAQEEIFGPVGAVIPFDDIDEAVRIANHSDYGLAATIWTQDVSSAHLLARRIRSGVVWVNGWGAIDPALPWGGLKKSGLGREMGWSGILANTEEKVITIVL